LLDKCSQFCSKHKGELYDDVSINIHNTIDIHLDEDKFCRSQGDIFLFDLFSNKLHICAENTVLYLLFYPCEILN
jgi:hypothetical protein